MLIIFDLDGVLLDARQIHFKALNKAAQFWSDDIASYDEHLQHLDGIPTFEKLKWFTRNKGTPPDTWGMIWKAKQKLTLEMIRELPPDPILRSTLLQVKEAGHVIACVSNSVTETVTVALDVLGVTDLFTYVAGTDKITEYKPHPECYLRAMIETGHEPASTVIVEDSPPGREAATRSGARVIPVAGPHEVTAERILTMSMEERSIPRWKVDWQVVIPMAGAGSRFAAKGYTFPKPLIDVNGKPMIHAVVDNLGYEAEYIFIVQKEHRAQYGLDALLKQVAPNCTVIDVDGITDGAADTITRAYNLLDKSRPVLVANSDQIMEWDNSRFWWSTEGRDGMIAAHESTHPKWSYIEANGARVTRLVEKEPISNIATTGVYWWRTAELMQDSINSMMAANDRTNGEFYFAPAYNYAISEGYDIGYYKVDAMHGVGTPEDLEAYLRSH